VTCYNKEGCDCRSTTTAQTSSRSCACVTLSQVGELCYLWCCSRVSVVAHPTNNASNTVLVLLLLLFLQAISAAGAAASAAACTTRSCAPGQILLKSLTNVFCLLLLLLCRWPQQLEQQHQRPQRDPAHPARSGASAGRAALVLRPQGRGAP
jgi:hypothetical protein